MIRGSLLLKARIWKQIVDGASASKTEQVHVKQLQFGVAGMCDVGDMRFLDE
jgi:hypothetical protein